MVAPTSRVLDVGCGSGVLAVAAAMCGAEAVGIDVDPTSQAVTEANAARTVFRAIPNRLVISLIGTPSARCNLRISAHCSISITLQEWFGGVKIRRRHGVIIHASLTRPERSRQ